jgi:hypothetical protein
MNVTAAAGRPTEPYRPVQSQERIMSTASTGFGPELYDDGREHPIWRSFNEAKRHALLQEDLSAGRSVSAVLVGVVTFGVLIGATAVMIACW